jgi:hypothetical protein
MPRSILIAYATLAVVIAVGLGPATGGPETDRSGPRHVPTAAGFDWDRPAPTLTL